jgi:hypothetical protein
MNRVRHVTYTIKDNMNRIRHVTYTVKQVEPGQTKVNCQQVMMNKCICLLKNKNKKQMLLIIGLFFWPTNLPLKKYTIILHHRRINHCIMCVQQQT